MSALNTLYKTGFIFCKNEKHECPWDKNFPESPDRLDAIYNRIKTLDLDTRLEEISYNEKFENEEFILDVHTEQLLENLNRIVQGPEDNLEKEAAQYDSVYFSKESLQAAKKSVASALSLLNEIVHNKIRNGFAIIRPPGHHAMKSGFNGYCYFNNVAIAAKWCLRNEYAKRILILDYDVHHGQGIQEAFYNTNEVLYISIHRYENGLFWPHLPESNFHFIGQGAGRGYNINIPLNEIELEDSDYIAIILNIVLPVAYEYNPDLILVAGGYDSCVGDEKGQMNLSPKFYSILMKLLSGLAGGKIAVFLEGGYFHPSLAEGVALTLKGLLGDPVNSLEPLNNIKLSVLDTINNVKTVLKKCWKSFKVCDNCGDDYSKLSKDHFTIVEYKGTLEESPYPTRNCYRVISEEEKSYYKKIVDTLAKETLSSTYLSFYYTIYGESEIRDHLEDTIKKCDNLFGINHKVELDQEEGYNILSKFLAFFNADHCIGILYIPTVSHVKVTKCCLEIQKFVVDHIFQTHHLSRIQCIEIKKDLIVIHLENRDNNQKNILKYGHENMSDDEIFLVLQTVILPIIFSFRPNITILTLHSIPNLHTSKIWAQVIHLVKTAAIDRFILILEDEINEENEFLYAINNAMGGYVEPIDYLYKNCQNIDYDNLKNLIEDNKKRFQIFEVYRNLPENIFEKRNSVFCKIELK